MKDDELHKALDRFDAWVKCLDFLADDLRKHKHPVAATHLQFVADDLRFEQNILCELHGPIVEKK